MPDLPNPESRVEQYLANLTDGTTEIPKEPESRIEQYLDYLAKNGGAGVNYGTAPAAAAGMALVAKTIVDGKVTEWEFGDAGGLKIHICTSSEYGQVSREPVISSPDEKTLYLVPAENGSAPDLFVEWAYVNNNWEMFGSASIGSIPDSVNEWLTEHITNPDNPPLDRSLTSSSAAAPADLVGEELTNLKQDLNYSKSATPGYVLSATNDGRGTKWIPSAGAPTDEQVDEAVSAWLDEHPEATTTVEDGSITQAKLNSLLSGYADFVSHIQETTPSGMKHVLNGIRFYVDCVNGDDSTGNGSQATPWKTLNKFFTEANRIDGGRIDLRCFLVSAGTYVVDADVGGVSHTFNHLTIHITGNVSGCVVQFAATEDVKFYECHCNFSNITIEAPNAMEFAFDGGSVAIKNCTFDCDVVMYAIQGYLESCSVKTLDLNECNLVLASISITNTDPSKDAIQMRTSTIRFQGSWQNSALSTQGASGKCFIRAVQSFVLIGITFRAQTNTYYNGLVNAVSMVFILKNTEKTLRERSQQGNLNNGGIIMICDEAVQQGVVNIENMQSNVRYVPGTGLQYYDGTAWVAIS